MHRVGGKNATEGKIQGDRAMQRIEDSTTKQYSPKQRPKYQGNANRIGMEFSSQE